MKKIMIDPGHGGSDPGATTSKPWPLRECDIAWTVSVLVRAELAAAGYTVFHSRRKGQDYGEADPFPRTVRARAVQADIYVSIHCNSVADPSAHGVEVLHCGSADGIRLADSIYSCLPLEKHELRGRGLKERKDLVVLNSTHCFAALVELPFLSNPDEAMLMTDAGFQIDFAKGIAQGIREYFK